MKKRRPLSVESLEARENPAVFGYAWTNPAVTVSTVPDGTSLDGTPSNLFAALGANGLSAAQVQGEVSRALQSWAAAGNLNFGWVGDNGSALGAAGAAQGDARFGDIRIAARPLDGQVLAITAPAGGYAGTRAGDIILNSNLAFSIGGAAGTFDLYTVLMQETGHAVGLGNNTTSSSVMFETYGGVRSGLAAADVTALNGLYGNRVDPAGMGNNNTQAYAFTVPAVAGTTTKYVRGDIESTADTDFFQFTTPSSVPSGVTVTLRTAGYSQLNTQVALLNAAGTVLASGVGANGANVVLTLPTAAANTTYYVRVQGADTGAYTLGGYKLSVATDPAAADPATAIAAPVYTADAGTNETAETATPPTAFAAPGTYGAYQVRATLDAGDTDYYKFAASDMRGNTGIFSITVRAVNGGPSPVVTAFNWHGVEVVGDVVTTDDGAGQTCQITGVVQGAYGYLRVTPAAGAAAGQQYELNATIQKTAVKYEVLATNTLTAAAPSVFRSVYVKRAQAMVFNLGATAAGVPVGGAAPVVTASIYSRAGQLVASWTTVAGTTGAKAIILLPGEYAIRVTAPLTGATTVAYDLRMLTLTDPIGLDPLDPNYVVPPMPPAPVIGSTTTSTTNPATGVTTTTTTTTDPTTGATTTTITTTTTNFIYVIYPPTYYTWLPPLL